MQERFSIKKIAVLGAGVMGAQIAAHCANAGFTVLLYDLPAKESDASLIAKKAIAHLNKLKPAPLALPETANFIKARNYADDLEDLKDCDLIIEAIAERLDLKRELYEKVAPYINPFAMFVTNTSGLSINTLAQGLPSDLQKRFFGVHFFNPPRYMHLVELIPSQFTDLNLVNTLETWVTRYLGKGIVRAKDTPNFIANRIGVFSLLIALHHGQALGLGFDEVDALTGPLLGRPKSATFRTMDVVGLDTMQHVIDTMREALKSDPWHHLFVLPDWFQQMVQKQHLGQKTGQGVYRKNGKIIEVYDVNTGNYRAIQGEVSEEIKNIMKLKPKEKFQQLFKSQNRQAQFLAAYFKDFFHYCAYFLEDIAHTVRDVDLALRWGFGWIEGPFETWQQAGVQEIKHSIASAIKEKETTALVVLPSWLDKLEHFYHKEGAYSPQNDTYLGNSALPVYQRQIIPEPVINQTQYKQDIIFENEGVKLWHLKDDVAVIGFKSKANSIGLPVLDGFNQALTLAEKNFQGLIIYQDDPNIFSSGADLRSVNQLIKNQRFDALENMIAEFQQLVMRMKYSFLPVIAALRGRALGGGCEILLHCDASVAAFESYPGLVELGVGLIPAGGGAKEMAKRAAAKALNQDYSLALQPYFEQIATAVVCTSAPEAKARGYLGDSSHWVMHKDEVLYVALQEIINRQAQNYLPPQTDLFPVAGREGHAKIQTGLVNWLEGGFISQHDYYLANQLAFVLCGGDVNQGTLVDENWLLKLEREVFVNLAATPLTQARISFLLETGKPLRN